MTALVLILSAVKRSVRSHPEPQDFVRKLKDRTVSTVCTELKPPLHALGETDDR